VQVNTEFQLRLQTQAEGIYAFQIFHVQYVADSRFYHILTVGGEGVPAGLGFSYLGTKMFQPMLLSESPRGFCIIPVPGGPKPQFHIIPAEGNQRELFVRKGGVVTWPGGAMLPSVSLGADNDTNWQIVFQSSTPP